MTVYKQIKDAVETFYTKTNWAGLTVERTPITKSTSNLYSDESLVEGKSESIDCYFTLDYKKLNRYFISEEGEVLSGDAFMLVKATQEINKNDIITYDNNKYRVSDTYRMVVNGVLTGIQANLFLID